MGAPYRDRSYQCPSCGATMREHVTRWVCDACGGMQLTLTDFHLAVEDLTAAPAVLQWSDGQPGHACPQCPELMPACTLVIVVPDDKTIDTRTHLQRCPQHGPWFAGKQLAEVFQAIERRMHAGQPTNGLPKMRWISDD